MQHTTSSLILAASLLLATATTTTFAIPTYSSNAGASMASAPGYVGGGSAYTPAAVNDYSGKAPTSAYPTTPTDVNDYNNYKPSTPAQSPSRGRSPSQGYAPYQVRTPSRGRSPAQSPSRGRSPARRSPSCQSSRASSQSSNRSSSSSSSCSRSSGRSRSRSRSRSFSIGGYGAFGRHRFGGVMNWRSLRGGRCRRRRLPYGGDYGVDSYANGGHGGYGVDNYASGGYGVDNYASGGYGVDNYANGGYDGGYGGYGGHGSGYGGYGGGYGGYGGRRQFSQQDYERHQHSENVHQSSVNRGGRGGSLSERQRHADESYLDESGHQMSMTDRYGQHASEHDHSLDAGDRTANSQDISIRGPHGRTLDASHRDGSVNTVSEDDHDRSFNGPNGFANESEQDISENSDQFSNDSEQVSG